MALAFEVVSEFDLFPPLVPVVGNDVESESDVLAQDLGALVARLPAAAD